MITGIIALIIGVAVIIPAVGNGQVWVAIAAGVAIVLVLALGVSSRESDRAYNNWTSYWAKGGPNGKRGSGGEKKREMTQEERREVFERAEELTRKSLERSVDIGSRGKEKWELSIQDDYIRRKYGIEPVNQEIWITCPKCGAKTLTTALTYVIEGETCVCARCMSCRNLYKLDEKALPPKQ